MKKCVLQYVQVALGREWPEIRRQCSYYRSSFSHLLTVEFCMSKYQNLKCIHILSSTYFFFKQKKSQIGFSYCLNNSNPEEATVPTKIKNALISEESDFVTKDTPNGTTCAIESMTFCFEIGISSESESNLWQNLIARLQLKFTLHR